MGTRAATISTSASADLIATRKREQRAAAEILGLKGGVPLPGRGKRDGRARPRLRRDLVRVIRKLKPDVVHCENPSSWFYGETYIKSP